MGEKQQEDKILGKIKTDLVNTGIFLESDTYQLFKNWNNDRVFKTYREYPYGYVGVGGTPIDGSVDVLAETGVSDYGEDKILILPIECKKADPKLKHWVFDPHYPTQDSEKQHFLTVSGRTNYYTNRYSLPSLGYNTFSDYENAVQVFEFSEVDGRISLQRQKELRAYYGIKQVNESIPGLVNKLDRFSRSVDVHNIFVPIVVTTANLWVAKYDPKKVDKDTGGIPEKEIELVAKDWVIYSYPTTASETLVGSAKDPYGDTVTITPDKRPTFIVKASRLEDFVNALIIDTKGYLEVFYPSSKN